MGVSLFTPRPGRGFECLLCPHSCLLKPGQTGVCGVRTADREGIHSSSTPVTVIAEDPIEKKPFYHYKPGSITLSLGFSGCNLKCPFCQNHSLVESHRTRNELTPAAVVKLASERRSSSVCYTYSEPTMHYDFLMDTTTALNKEGIPSLLVTNGCINESPARELLGSLSAVKVDLKSFSAEWYRKELMGDLATVCRFIEAASELTHLEVVTLVIPGKNDSEAEIASAAGFLAKLNPDIPYHLTAYYPQHRYKTPPTSPALLNRLQETARQYLNHVYTGNTGVLDRTYCPGCGELLIDRPLGNTSGISSGCCTACGRGVYGIF